MSFGISLSELTPHVGQSQTAIAQTILEQNALARFCYSQSKLQSNFLAFEKKESSPFFIFLILL